ncbi:uncharacterized protein MELLADRAFT_116140 [Melampsora larici-populina 98AG31]|uniref:Uncharacterized protein n=1 Tax=Melampsora larici-populina (strain 98AG31 / pathotype 3-4-7) TaxID=747676 RepID=F4RI24_MELLP|nr:uncharacterized protein MELLADRAFT_116140 [Melampsora larici-populina 98AG31]EGG07924.1 hypothetical protein MELLADRAFT_116140 [Melampsora larici-populina 98AG31]
MHPQLPEVLTTVLIKFDKVTILLPINKSTTLLQLKQTCLNIFQSSTTTTTTTSLNQPINQLNQLNQFDFFRRKDQKNSSHWILCDLSSSLNDLDFKEAEVLGVGFVNSNGICSEPKIQVWIESEINQEE